MGQAREEPGHRHDGEKQATPNQSSMDTKAPILEVTLTQKPCSYTALCFCTLLKLLCIDMCKRCTYTLRWDGLPGNEQRRGGLVQPTQGSVMVM